MKAERTSYQLKKGVETSLMWAIKDLLDDAVELARKIPLPAEF